MCVHYMRSQCNVTCMRVCYMLVYTQKELFDCFLFSVFETVSVAAVLSVIAGVHVLVLDVYN